MNIAYSCAGEGFGHAARVAALYPALSEHHTVTLFIPVPVQDFIQERLGSVPLITIPCLEFEKKDNTILFWKTLITNMRRIPQCLRAVIKLARMLRELDIDLIISDFDPLLPRAAKLAGIPVIQLNHPGIVRRFISWDPRSWFTALAARLLEGPADRRIYVSFFGGDAGPIIRKSLLVEEHSANGKIVVNVKGKARKKIVPVLESQPGLQYELFPRSEGGFDRALASCSGVITTAGHQTISEALVLGKPLLVIPQHAQYEQLLNAKMLVASKRGTFCFIENLGTALPCFLKRLSSFTSSHPKPAWLIDHDDYKQLIFLLERTITRLCKKYHQYENTKQYMVSNQ